ncbi:MAG: bifunctional diaminohydroxyphosphoribosylaminopyrimidine deaminase/5-amino-6-(5-phosphoribosylamino)uracil reductase RibD [Saprospiraceae bacterium]|jgi:diaminohydroxyphosphoribosylaminopyrimidine deaminase/5-amino-6-(5-phosphoribosylamino)uracil reductase|nr:bifunctional diaminohydroxyphosphoribosylaminopyrimidine deaminase/5-amino-6-(5-phosphoribosylamino)uracil reductase RibD [Saprospiraceae bacterium]
MSHEIYMHRCFDLARLGTGHVSPNPMVGAVLVHDDRIIGEGWHRAYGQAHAEVNCLASVKDADRHLMEEATLYVSLEPCCFHGKTPACTDLILRSKIPKVVIACLDETPEVQGKGVEILKKAGVEVVEGILADQPFKPSDFRNCFVSKKRPFIQLKFAQSVDGFMGKPGEQVWLSNHFSQVLAHKGRAAFDAILVGTQTALTDNPRLDTRHWPGKSPLRIVLDSQRKIPFDFHLLQGGQRTWVICEKLIAVDNQSDTLQFWQFAFDENMLKNMLNLLFEHKITSLIVEGGSRLLHSFLAENLWDEAAIFTAPKRLGEGVLAPKPMGKELARHELGGDSLTILRNEHVGR